MFLVAASPLLDHHRIVPVTPVPAVMSATIPSMVPPAIHVMVVVTSLDDDRFGRGESRRCNSQRKQRRECKRNFLHFKSSSIKRRMNLPWVRTFLRIIQNFLNACSESLIFTGFLCVA